MLYLLIFIFKIIDDAFSTMRLIVINNGKKVLGGLLQLITTIIWVLLTGYVLIDFMEDIYKIIAFSLGSFFGSYVGCLIEEKIGMGTNSFLIKSNRCNYIKNKLISYNIGYIDISDNIIIIVFPRKRRKSIVKLIKSLDNSSCIICEKIKYY